MYVMIGSATIGKEHVKHKLITLVSQLEIHFFFYLTLNFKTLTPLN
jgi:hypothetical protein